MENLVGYAKSDLMVPARPPSGTWRAAQHRGHGWCAEVNAAVTSEICAIPAERLVAERELLATAAVAATPDRRVQVSARSTGCRVCAIGSARYSVPVRLIGQTWR